MKTEKICTKELLHIKIEYIFQDLEHYSIRFITKNNLSMQSYFQYLKKTRKFPKYYITFVFRKILYNAGNLPTFYLYIPTYV